MKVVSIHQEYDKKENDICVILVGSFTTTDWCDEVINELSKFNNTDNLVIFNPINFDGFINSEKRTLMYEWINEKLNDCDLLTIYFTDDDVYEWLGYISLIKTTYYIKLGSFCVGLKLTNRNENITEEQINNFRKHILIGYESDCDKPYDQLIENESEINDVVYKNFSTKDFATEIYNKYLNLMEE